MLDLMNEYGLVQLVHEPTRITENTSSILDLLFVQNEYNFQTDVVPGISDHLSVVSTMNIIDPIGRKGDCYIRTVKCYKNVDLVALLNDAMCRYINFDDRVPGSSTEELWAFFKQDMADLLNKHVPVRRVRNKKNLSKPWIKYNTNRQIQKRRRLQCRQKKQHLDTRQKEILRLNKLIVEGLSENKKDFMSSLKTKKSGELWKYINRYKKKGDDMGALYDEDKESHLINDGDKANLLNRTFQRAFSGCSNEFPVFLDRTESCLNHIEFTVEGIEALILKQDINVACGPDGIRSRDLRLIAPVASLYLQIIYQRSFDTSTVPKDWRCAVVTPVFKAGCKNDPKNYRPISLTSIPCKIMEHIIISSMMKFLVENNLLNKCQFGFRAGASTELLLITLLDYLLDHIQKGGQVDAIAIDLSKAFDKVPHDLLIYKLSKYGFIGSTANWFEAFLTGRTQTVRVGNSVSEVCDVKSGVPQGSTSGPLLFLVYLNDLLDQLSCPKVYFADDGTIYKSIYDESDQILLNNDLHVVQTWCCLWSMVVNWEKTNFVQFTRCRDENVKNFNYGLDLCHLSKTSVIKLLGVWLEDTLTWNTHIRNITAVTSKSLYLITRLARNSSRDIKLLLYKGLVRPQLEYAMGAWSPHTQNLVDDIEKIQSRAIRFIVNDYSRCLSITSTRAELNLDKMRTRRDIRRLTLFYSISNNLTQVTAADYCKPPSYIGRHDHSFKYSRITGKTDYYIESFFPSTVRMWNALPQDTVDAKDAKTFTGLLKSIDLDKLH